ncbi:MAG: molybdopterin-dependent oxidoreductase, partial [Acidobacteriota bacterium]
NGSPMNRRREAYSALCLCVLLVAVTSAQTTLPAATFISLSISAKGHDGKEGEYPGTALVEVLKLAGAKFGEDLRGRNLALYLVVEAADGYRAVYALPELDPLYTHKSILLATKREGKPLDDKEGPLRIVVPDEKRQARWVRQVTGADHQASTVVQEKSSK